ncbi:hypothetical protein MUNTM_22490 [Mycobacterium sp. MUNTM1]
MGAPTAGRYLGGFALSDLAQIREGRGEDYLPYPFMQTGRPGLGVDTAIARDELSYRLTDGDLSAFQGWIREYPRADIWLECRVLHRLGAIPDTRISAFRAGQFGFCASQRFDVDVVDVYQVSPYELGAAVCGSLQLSQPGNLARISVPKYVNYFRASPAHLEDDDYELSVFDVRPRNAGPIVTEIPNADVAAIGTVQSRCLPARSWGMDWRKKLVAWVQISEDGDYVYQPDFDYAVPMTKQHLMGRIDELIAEDVAVLRRRRENL